jgi:uncharacterized membrane protein
MKFFKSNITSLVTAALTLIFFLFFALLGTGTIFSSIDPNAGVTYYYNLYQLHQVNADGTVPSIAVFIGLIFIFELVNINKKARNVRTKKFFNGLFYIVIFSLSLYSFITLITNIKYRSNYQVYGLGIAVLVFMAFTFVLSAFGTVLNFIQFALLPNPSTETNGSNNKNKNTGPLERLKTLKMLLDKGAITDEEYNRISKKYIDKL